MYRAKLLQVSAYTYFISDYLLVTYFFLYQIYAILCLSFSTLGKFQPFCQYVT